MCKLSLSAIWKPGMTCTDLWPLSFQKTHFSGLYRKLYTEFSGWTSTKSINMLTKRSTLVDQILKIDRTSYNVSQFQFIASKTVQNSLRQTIYKKITSKNGFQGFYISQLGFWPHIYMRPEAKFLTEIRTYYRILVIFLYILDLSEFYSVLEAVNYNIERSDDVFAIFKFWSTLVDLLGNICWLLIVCTTE